MTMEKIVLEFFKSLLLKRTELIDKPINLYYELAKPIIEKSKKEELKRNAKKFIKIQKTEQGKD